MREPEILQRTEREGRLYVVATLMLDPDRGLREDWSFFVRIEGAGVVVDVDQIRLLERRSPRQPWQTREEYSATSEDLARVSRDRRRLLQLAVGRAIGTLPAELRPKAFVCEFETLRVQ